LVGNDDLQVIAGKAGRNLEAPDVPWARTAPTADRTNELAGTAAP